MKILFFTAKWCGQCKVVKPKFIDVCKEHDFTNYEIIDVDDESNSELVLKYNIRNLPTAIFFSKNNNADGAIRKLGFDIPRETELQINKNKQYD